MTQQTVNPGVATFVVVQIRCVECGALGPTVEKSPGATVRITYQCHGRACRGGYQQRQQV